ncbi:MAG: GDSL-type esterase/lipase family protein [Candidatus Uhrbacteria bacterium]
MSKYCIFGDSITRGAGDPEHGGWAGRFLRERETVSDDRVYVLGINGDTSTGLLARVEVEVRARKADAIVIMIGINDSRYYGSKDKPETTIDGYRENLAKIVGIARTFTPRITMISMTRVDETKTMPIEWSTEKFYDNATIASYESVLREFCASEGLPFVDVSDVLTVDDLGDGIHPNAEGYRKLFERIRVSV